MKALGSAHPFSEAAQQIEALLSYSPCSRDESIYAAVCSASGPNTLGGGHHLQTYPGQATEICIHAQVKEKFPTHSVRFWDGFAGLGALLYVYQLAELGMF